ncbi:TetR family transcriptional regulator [Altericroceibacterium spongiae]|uniref:TetR family transcriptional regulator n=1 Tax=Altericroceibacterium spongiae TaxID=2320269 RepID=A0A420EK07_9SPHN|nr:TetR family transcriptional regulator [Altericroceibacterium spongiae]RKF20998.1 TetR family transcriptional regulator [Altericroceibacterium spongiae]
MLSRKRLSSKESRMVALEAARALLIESGPQSVTLKAVAARIDRTHANLLHHFGSAAGLQSALSEHLAKTVCATIADAMRARRAGLSSAREVVDLTFDAFDREGGGQLASWMLVSGNEDALNPIVESIHSLMDEFAPTTADDPEKAAHDLREVTLGLVLMALGDALLGSQLSASLDLDRSTARERAEHMLQQAVPDARVRELASQAG